MICIMNFSVYKNTMEIIDGKKIKEEILSQIKKEVANLPFQPVFCDILVGEDMASMQYVQMKAKTAERVGIKFHNANFPSTITTAELSKEVQNLNKIENMCGIIVQLPLPSHIDTKAILDAVDPRLDVDCLGGVCSNEFYSGSEELVPPTALACMAILNSLNLDIKGKNIVVLGNGKLVGRPVSQLFKNKGYQFNTLNTSSLNKPEIIKEADIIISGIGQGKYLEKEMVKDGVVVIDAGTSEENGSVVGDVDFDSVKEKASYITPVPGGVGPVTVAMLLNNVLSVAKKLK
jgi:methylenetetrahydrofolate dehydrogenase (NADP+) / methenyltetrahydrofolate cyclohydrolase